MNKYLIIRFSSFGDIIQALPSATALRESEASAEIHWLTRSDFHDIVRSHSIIDQIWSLRREEGFRGLFKLAKKMTDENFTHIYDAHNNLRSLLLCLYFKFKNPRLKILRRSKNRLNRILLFKFRINRFDWPFRGVKSYLEPLNKWFNKNINPQNLSLKLDDVFIDSELENNLPQMIVLAPSATWELKRWPIEYWSKLIGLMPQHKFVVLGGEADKFCDDIAAAHPQNTKSLRGRLSWLQSAKIVLKAKAIVSGDTGIMHLADGLGRPTLALIGPTAFGYPTFKNAHVLEMQLSCKPCTKDGRGRCVNSEYKKCLTSITPELVATELKKLAPV